MRVIEVSVSAKGNSKNSDPESLLKTVLHDYVSR